MARRPELRITARDGGITVTMPPGGNRWIIGLGLGLGVPWLAGSLGVTVAVPLVAPAGMLKTALLGACALNLLFFLAHMLAVAGVWLAAYQLRGAETLEVSDEACVVGRRGLGITVPIRLGRTGHESITLLDTTLTPGKGPHPRLELRSGNSAVRFGAGLSESEAEAVCEAVRSALAQSVA